MEIDRLESTFARPRSAKRIQRGWKQRTLREFTLCKVDLVREDRLTRAFVCAGIAEVCE